jgi:hypothetical protein
MAVLNILLPLAFFLVYALPGVAIGGVAFYWTKRLPNTTVRLLVRAALISLAIAPVPAGHSVAPAVWVFFAPDPRLWWFGLLPLLIVWLVSVLILFGFSRSRKSV